MAQTTTAYATIMTVVQGNQAFIDRVSAATVNAAVDIAAEASSTVNYARRQALVPKVLQSPSTLATQFAIAIACQQNLTASPAPTDAQLYTGAVAVWSAMAGVS
jgi:hypothetical protein